MFENLAVVGATGAVGRIVCRLLEERQFPFKQIKFLSSARSAGSQLMFHGRPYLVEQMRPESFDGVDLVIASTPDDVAREFVPWAVERGAVVVDESGAWRMDDKTPLVVPEVNPQAIRDHRGIIASPNCSTTQMVVALKPLHDAGRLRRVVVSTYQAASGAGLAAGQELLDGARAALDQHDFHYQQFAHPLAFNLIPQIGSPKYEGYTSEEMKMVWETHKIFGDDTIQICPTCVRVPVRNCHSESILAETERKITAAEARRLFQQAEGVTLIDDLSSKQYPMPLNGDDQDDVFVGRIREDISSPNGLAFWCVSDNLRKGAATNAVQIAEMLVAPGTAMQYVKLTVAYDGGAYAGWQVQPGRATLQQTLEDALAAVTGQRVRTVASGRTDAGVHALGQTVSLATDCRLPPETLRRAINANLPDDIVVLDACAAPPGFHAIRDAVGKRYRYLIHNGPVRDVFTRRYAWHVWRPLDSSAMHQAAQTLRGRHDFASYQASGANRASSVRDISDIFVRRGAADQRHCITIEVAADGFLYNMVRNIVGVLVEVGRGAQSVSWPQHVLAARDRRAGAATAPPQGLYLVRVQYPEGWFPAHERCAL